MKKYIMGISLIVVTILICIFLSSNPQELISSATTKKVASNNYTEVQFHFLGNSEIQLIKVDGFTILINTGLEKDRDELHNVLEQNDVSKIDYLIITNKQSCFLGNISYVLNKYEVEYLYLNSHDSDNKYTDQLSEAINNNFIEVISLSSTENINIGNMKMNIYSTSSNNVVQHDSGLVVDITSGKNSILIRNNSTLNVDKDKYTLYVFSTPSGTDLVKYAYYIYNSDEKIKGNGKKLNQNTTIKMNEKEFIIK